MNGWITWTVNVTPTRRAVLALVLALLAMTPPSPWAGSTFVRADQVSSYTHATALHYKFYLEPPDSPQFKIIFGWANFHTPGAVDEYYQIETNVWSFGVRDVGNDCEEGLNVTSRSETAYSVEVPDYPTESRIGMRLLNPDTQTYFGLRNGGIDRIAGLSKIGSWYRGNASYIVADVTIARVGRVTHPGPSWGPRFLKSAGYACSSDIPPGTYWVWEVTSEGVGVIIQHNILIPENQGQYLDPDAILMFLTEFMAWPGRWRAVYWDVWLQDEVAGKVAVNDFLVFYRDNAGTPAPVREDWGVKLGMFQGHPVLEISSGNGTGYLPVGGTLSLSGKGAAPLALSRSGLPSHRSNAQFLLPVLPQYQQLRSE